MLSHKLVYYSLTVGDIGKHRDHAALIVRGRGRKVTLVLVKLHLSSFMQTHDLHPHQG